MRILFYTASFLPTVGGAEHMLHNIASAMVSRGHEATVLAPFVRGADNTVEASYRVVRYQRPSSKRFGTRQVLLYLLRERVLRSFDVLHCHGVYPPGYVGSAYKKLFGTPYIIRPHGADILHGEHIRANPRLERRSLKALLDADAVVAQSEDLKRLVVEMGVPEAKVVLIPNGVDTGIYRSSSGPAPVEGQYVLALGSLTPKKGFDVLVRAMAEVLREKTDIKLVIGGEGPERANLNKLVNDLGISRSVTMPGMLKGSEKVAAIRGCMMGISSSNREPFSNSNLEFMAAGKPLVATAVGGNIEVIRDNYNGILVEKGDHAAMAEAILRLSLDAGLRLVLEANTLEAVKAYELEHIAGQYENLYAGLAGRAL